MIQFPNKSEYPVCPDCGFIFIDDLNVCKCDYNNEGDEE
jgi:hypothetical protein